MRRRRELEGFGFGFGFGSADLRLLKPCGLRMCHRLRMRWTRGSFMIRLCHHDMSLLICHTRLYKYGTLGKVVRWEGGNKVVSGKW